MFQLQGTIMRPVYKNRSLSNFWCTIGSKLFTLLGYCCIQYFNLVKMKLNGRQWSIVLKYTIKLELLIKRYNCFVAYYVRAAPYVALLRFTPYVLSSVTGF
jgi:hypothetical protein